MKALKMTGPNKMIIDDVPIPELESEDEILVEVYYCGICKSDIELLHGTHPHMVNKNCFYPVIPGHEWSGVVVKAGKDVSEFVIGDRVVGDVSLGCGHCDMCKTGRFNLCPTRDVIGSFRNRQGAFAQYIRTHRRSLYKIPDKLTLKEAATIEPAATAAYATKKSKVKYGDRVLIMGDGSIGLFAIETCKAFGAGEIVLIGSWPEKLEVAKNIGADYAFSYRTGNAIGEVKTVMKDKMFDVVIDCSGKTSSINQAIDLVKPGGVVGMVSFYDKSSEVKMNDIITKDAEIQGILASPNMFNGTLLNMANGLVDAKPLITQEFAFKDIENAFECMESRDEMSVKIVVNIKGE